MTLNLISIGLCNEKDITLRGLELIKKSEKVYLENYTSRLSCELSDLENLYDKKIILADRCLIENGEEILNASKKNNVSLLIIGDVFSATTHIDLYMRALEQNIEVNIVNNASILTAIGITGLSLYKFGKTTSLPFENENIETPYNILQENKNLHTLILLDLDPKNNKYMQASTAIKYLLKTEDKKKKNIFNENTNCIICAKLGCPDFKIIYGSAKNLKNINLEKYPQCLIIPGKMHFMEEEFLEKYKKN